MYACSITRRFGGHDENCTRIPRVQTEYLPLGRHAHCGAVSAAPKRLSVFKEPRSTYPLSGVHVENCTQPERSTASRAAATLQAP